MWQNVLNQSRRELLSQYPKGLTESHLAYHFQFLSLWYEKVDVAMETVKSKPWEGHGFSEHGDVQKPEGSRLVLMRRVSTGWCCWSPGNPLEDGDGKAHGYKATVFVFRREMTLQRRSRASCNTEENPRRLWGVKYKPDEFPTASIEKYSEWIRWMYFLHPAGYVSEMKALARTKWLWGMAGKISPWLDHSLWRLVTIFDSSWLLAGSLKSLPPSSHDSHPWDGLYMSLLLVRTPFILD